MPDTRLAKGSLLDSTRWSHYTGYLSGLFAGVAIGTQNLWWFVGTFAALFVMAFIGALVDTRRGVRGDRA